MTEGINSASCFDSIYLLHIEQGELEWKGKKQNESTENIHPVKDEVTISIDGKTYTGTVSSTQDIDPSAVHVMEERYELEANSSIGTHVSVKRESTGEISSDKEIGEIPPTSYSITLTRANGSTLKIDFADNIEIYEEGDTGTSVYFSEGNVTHFYRKDGSFTEISGNRIGKDASKIIVNTRSDSIQTGNGDNIIFNWADNAEIITGNGNDTIILRDNAQGNTIYTGAGNDTIKGHLVSNSNIDLGEGNNTFFVTGIRVSTLRSGDGDNKISIENREGDLSFSDFRRINNSIIEVGNGNNVLNMGMIVNSSKIHIGDGNNIFEGSISGNSAVTIGNGDNKIRADVGYIPMSEWLIAGLKKTGTQYSFPEEDGPGSLLVGNGNNQFKSLSAYKDGIVEIGNGNNKFNVQYVKLNGIVVFGNGNNFGEISEIIEEGNVSFGNGNNLVKATSVRSMCDNATMIFGDGDNSVGISGCRDNAAVVFGNGNNAAYVYMRGNSSISFGNGNNNISFGGFTETSKLTTGDGDNLIGIRELHDGTTMNIGTGNNLVLVNHTEINDTLSDKDIIILDRLKPNERSEILSEFTRRYVERKSMDLPTAASLFNEVTLSTRIRWSMEYKKRTDDPNYFGEMDADERLNLLRQDITASSADTNYKTLWIDAMRDPDTKGALDSYI